MYKSTPITKKAGSALHLNETLVEGSKKTFRRFSEADPYKKITKNTGEGEDSTTTTEKSEKSQVGGYRRACGSKNDGSTGTDPETGNTFVCEQAENGKEPEEMENVKGTTSDTEGTPDKTNYQATEIMEATKQNVLGDIETRELGRTVKKTGKDSRRADIKQARIEDKTAKFEKRRGKDIKPGQKGYRKQQRLKAKTTETKGEKAAFDEAFLNAQDARKSGKSIGSSIPGKDRTKTQGQDTTEEQIANDRLKQEMVRSTQTDSQRYANKAKSIGMNGFKLTEFDSSAGNAFVNKYKSPFGMNRTSMKKNYFKK